MVDLKKQEAIDYGQLYWNPRWIFDPPWWWDVFNKLDPASAKQILHTQVETYQNNLAAQSKVLAAQKTMIDAQQTVVDNQTAAAKKVLDTLSNAKF